jgi:hypothetical protein
MIVSSVEKKVQGSRFKVKGEAAQILFFLRLSPFPLRLY